MDDCEREEDRTIATYDGDQDCTSDRDANDDEILGSKSYSTYGKIHSLISKNEHLPILQLLKKIVLQCRTEDELCAVEDAITNIRCSKRTWQALPPELVFEIARWLTPLDIIHFSQSCHWFRSCIQTYSASIWRESVLRNRIPSSLHDRVSGILNALSNGQMNTTERGNCTWQYLAWVYARMQRIGTCGFFIQLSPKIPLHSLVPVGTTPQTIKSFFKLSKDGWNVVGTMMGSVVVIDGAGHTMCEQDVVLSSILCIVKDEYEHCSRDSSTIETETGIFYAVCPDCLVVLRISWGEYSHIALVKIIRFVLGFTFFATQAFVNTANQWITLLNGNETITIPLTKDEIERNDVLHQTKADNIIADAWVSCFVEVLFSSSSLVWRDLYTHEIVHIMTIPNPFQQQEGAPYMFVSSCELGILFWRGSRVKCLPRKVVWNDIHSEAALVDPSSQHLIIGARKVMRVMQQSCGETFIRFNKQPFGRLLTFQHLQHPSSISQQHPPA
eukprot:m.66643 g.66643  ORF g.66643 m.66643 type:complete len:500 (-) comp8196_c1_seq2:1057-2556(-)